MFRKRAMMAAVVAATVAVAAPVAAEPARTGGLITLPTGDRVLLTGPGEVHVLPARGREHLTFLHTTDRRGNVHVVPSDVAPRVAAGEVDLSRYTVSEHAGPALPAPRTSRVEQPVEIDLLDRDGAPASTYSLIVFNLDTGESTWLYDGAGTVSTQLPEGRYLVYADVTTYPAGGDSVRTYFAEPGFVVDGHVRLVLDSRLGTPVDVRVDESNAQEGETSLSFLATTPLGEVGVRAVGNSGFAGTFLAPSTTAGPEFRFSLQAALAEPDGAGGFGGSPYLYHVRWGQDGSVPADPDRAFQNEQLAKVVSEHAVETPGLYGVRENMVSAPLPFSLTEYYTPDVPWSSLFTESDDPSAYERSYAFDATPRVYRMGEESRVRWNTGVFGPAFPAYDPPPETFSPNVSQRRGDRVEFQIPLFTDQNPYRMGDTGTVGDTTGTTELLRDNTVLHTENYPGDLYATVPPDPGTYTLRTTAHRQGFRLSTEVSATWTFPSAHTTDTEPLPLLAVRFAPALDLQNTAPAGRFRLPVYVQRNGAGVVTHRPSIAVSYDDGATWHQTRVQQDRDQWLAVLNHPSDAEFVSLRATASDGTGSNTRQTILRAYAIR
jgi:hypothetical protein